MTACAAVGDAAVKSALPVVVAPRAVSAESADDAPVPPALIGRGVFASVTRSAMSALYDADVMVVIVVAVLPGGAV